MKKAYWTSVWNCCSWVLNIKWIWVKICRTAVIRFTSAAWSQRWWGSALLSACINIVTDWTEEACGSKCNALFYDIVTNRYGIGKTKSNPRIDVVSLQRTISNRARQREIIKLHSNNPGRGKRSPNGKMKGQSEIHRKTGKARLWLENPRAVCYNHFGPKSRTRTKRMQK